MSQENVEIGRGIIHAINRGDVDYVIRHTTEDVVIVAARSAVEGSFMGHEGVRAFFADNRQNFEVFELREHDVREAGDDRVLSFGTVHVRGRGGGVETEVPFAGITTFRGGRASRWEDFRERDLALAAVGLAE
jgi:ketosteroid isomerase-like protein